MKNIEKLVEKSSLEGNDKSFVSRVFSNGVSKYQLRLKQYKFNNLDKVLDAGCGFGQWTLALASINKSVYACDVSSNRIDFLNTLANSVTVKNIQTKISSIEVLPYEDNYFDAVFCYGVLFVTPWKTSLKELLRVLKPGGRLYVNANGLGWYKHLWYTEHNRVDGYSPRQVAAEVWINTYKYQNNQSVPFPTQIMIEPEELINEIKNYSVQNIVMDGEGLINKPDNKNTFFKKDYYGDVGVYEVISEKK